MRRTWNLPLERDVGLFIILVILSVTVIGVERFSEKVNITGQLARVFVPFQAIASRLMNFSYVDRENEFLRSKIVNLARENALLREQVHETVRLGRLLDFAAARPETLIPARVLGYPGERMGGGIVIDKGEAAGVTRNMTVISYGGLVGTVIKVGRGASQVRRIIDPGYRVSAMLQRSRSTGILGAPGYKRLVMEWVAPDADVAVGDTVISSGLGSITPKGIPIGTVGRVQDRPGEFSLAVEVDPLPDFDRLEEVFVILREPPDFRVLLGGPDNPTVER
jgi:rod shape-determining protein MreC